MGRFHAHFRMKLLFAIALACLVAAAAGAACSGSLAGLDKEFTVSDSDFTYQVNPCGTVPASKCNGQPNQSEFEITCKKGASAYFTFDKYDESSCTYKFKASADEACGASTTSGASSGGSGGGGGGAAKKKKGLSIGSILLICALCLTVTYCAAGMAFNFQVKGQRGIDIIPQRSFWISVPGLIKDGVLFVYSKITGKDSYTSLP